MNYSSEILGGILIGLASALPLILEGRIAGVSGYAAGALRPTNRNARTGLVFVLGLVLGGALWNFSGGQIPAPVNLGGRWFWPLAGLLVGFGARYGGGCTSGHGVCGLGRLSHRSFAAVSIFMAAAIAVVSLREVLK